MVHVLHAGRLQSKNSGVSVKCVMPQKDITHIFCGVGYNYTVKRQHSRIKREAVLEFTTRLWAGGRKNRASTPDTGGKTFSLVQSPTWAVGPTQAPIQ